MDQQFNPNIQSNPPIQSIPPAVQPPKNTWKIVALVIIGILVLGGAAWGGYYWWQNYGGNKDGGNKVFCTGDAKQCSDGSYVSRTGPNCEFAACPSASVSASPSAIPDPTADWQTYKNEYYGFEVKYPADWFSKACGASYVGFSYNQSELPKCYTEGPQPHINIKVMENTTTTVGINKYIEDEDMQNSLDDYSKTEIKVNGNISATKLSGFYKKIEAPGPFSGIKTIEVLFLYNNNIYQVYYYGLDGRDYVSIFDQILSTFKFTK